MRSAPSQRPPKDSVILLVDDNRDGVLARQSVLQEVGYRVLTASSGEGALSLMDANTIDLVITDYKMRPVNGLELIVSLREKKPDIPVILLTGFADALGLDPESTGANVVLQKNANELNALLRTAKRLLQLPRKPARSQTAGKVLKAKGGA